MFAQMGGILQECLNNGQDWSRLSMEAAGLGKSVSKNGQVSCSGQECDLKTGYAYNSSLHDSV